LTRPRVRTHSAPGRPTSADSTGRAGSTRKLRGRRGPDNHVRPVVRLRLDGVGVRRRWPGAEPVARNTNLNKTWARPPEEKAAPTSDGRHGGGGTPPAPRCGKTERSNCSTCVRAERRTPRFRRRRGTGQDFTIGALRRCARLANVQAGSSSNSGGRHHLQAGHPAWARRCWRSASPPSTSNWASTIPHRQGGLLNELPYRHRQQRSDNLPLEGVYLIEESAGSDPVGSMTSRLAPHRSYPAYVYTNQDYS
jgi:hypothetical protein